METTLLIGSGVSKYSGMPMLGDITNVILNPAGVERSTDSNYYMGYKDISQESGYIKQVRELIALVHDSINEFYKTISTIHKSNHKCNYEDIFYAIQQIYDSYTLEFENPAVYALMQNIKALNRWTDQQLIESSKEALKFIECIVWQMLDKEIESTKQFEIIPELIQSGLKNIVSLNQDIVLEQYLESNGISFYDGFIKDNDKFPEWRGFEQESESKLKLCKVHGSVDWFSVSVKEERNALVKFPSRIIHRTIPDKVNDNYRPNQVTPALLIGTFNKMHSYLSDIYEQQYEELKNIIGKSDCLIISGYGFADKGINTRLTGWLNGNHSKKMIIIHPNRDELLANSRGSFKINIMTKHDKHEKVVFIESKFETVEFSQSLFQEN